MTTRIAVEELVYRSCLLLDAGDFDGFLDLCHPEFRYVVEAYGPEIRRSMVVARSRQARHGDALPQSAPAPKLDRWVSGAYWITQYWP
jgi:hypothetical protein